MNRDTLTEWVIFCPGPLLKGLKLRHIGKYESSRAIAVNGAILKGFPVRYWAMVDNDAFMSVIKDRTAEEIISMSKKHLLWIPNSWIAQFKNWAPEYHHCFKIFFYETWPVSELSSKMPFARQIKWDECSMFASMALAILNGAKTIKIYGAGMKGQGYFKQGLENFRTQHTEKRWDNEKLSFNKIVMDAAKNGIDIKRILPRNYEKCSLFERLLRAWR